MVRLARPEGAAVLQELQTVQNAIDDAQDDLRNNNILKALQELNSADSRSVKTQSARFACRRGDLRSRNKTSTLINYTPRSFPHKILSVKTTLKESGRS